MYTIVIALAVLAVYLYVDIMADAFYDADIDDLDDDD